MIQNKRIGPVVKSRRLKTDNTLFDIFGALVYFMYFHSTKKPEYFAEYFGVDVNNAWPLTFNASSVYKIELRPLISGFYFALLGVRNLCMASRLTKRPLRLHKRQSKGGHDIFRKE